MAPRFQRRAFALLLLLALLAVAVARRVHSNAPARAGSAAAEVSADARLSSPRDGAGDEAVLSSDAGTTSVPAVPASASGAGDDKSSVRARRAEERARTRELRVRAQQLYDSAESSRRDASSASAGEAALALYREAAGLEAGPGSASAYAALARMHEVGWAAPADAPDALAHVTLPRTTTMGGSWLSRLLRVLNLSGRSYTVYGAGQSLATGGGGGGGGGSTPLLVAPNMTEAVRLYSRAAALGNATAQFTVAVLHAHGLFGAALDEPLAVTNLFFAALGGSEEAALALAHRHSHGLGVPRSCVSAVSYLDAPAANAARSVEASHGLLSFVPHLFEDRLNDETLEGLATVVLESGGGRGGAAVGARKEGAGSGGAGGAGGGGVLVLVLLVLLVVRPHRDRERRRLLLPERGGAGRPRRAGRPRSHVPPGRQGRRAGLFRCGRALPRRRRGPRPPLHDQPRPPLPARPRRRARPGDGGRLFARARGRGPPRGRQHPGLHAPLRAGRGAGPLPRRGSLQESWHGGGERGRALQPRPPLHPRDPGSPSSSGGRRGVGIGIGVGVGVNPARGGLGRRGLPRSPSPGLSPSSG
jgi:hypothetical protein